MGFKPRESGKCLVGKVSFREKIGIRYHEDDEARFQQDDGYSMVQSAHVAVFLAGLPRQSSRMHSPQLALGRAIRY